MAAQTPDQVHAMFVRLFNQRDLDGLLDMYVEDAVLLDKNGPCRGKAAIREHMQGLLATGASLHMDTRVATVGPGVALLSADWRVEGVGSGKTAEVAVQGADGLWRVAVDHPMGI